MVLGKLGLSTKAPLQCSVQEGQSSAVWWGCSDSPNPLQGPIDTGQGQGCWDNVPRQSADLKALMRVPQPMGHSSTSGLSVRPLQQSHEDDCPADSGVQVAPGVLWGQRHAGSPDWPPCGLSSKLARLSQARQLLTGVLREHFGPW